MINKQIHFTRYFSCYSGEYIAVRLDIIEYPSYSGEDIAVRLDIIEHPSYSVVFHEGRN